MKFKILKGTQLFEKFIELQSKMASCNKASIDLMKEVGATHVRGESWQLAGGAGSFSFSEKPKGWKNAPNGERGEYMPMKSNKEMISKVKSLPRIPIEIFQDLLNYDYTDSDNNKLSFHPGWSTYDDYILLEFASQYSRYKPVDDMIEITASDYNKLKVAA